MASIRVVKNVNPITIRIGQRTVKKVVASEKAATNRAKAKGNKKGKQFVELNQKYLDQGTPFFAPASDLAVMVGILSILYPDSDPPNFPTSIGRSPNIDYFYYDTDH